MPSITPLIKTDRTQVKASAIGVVSQTDSIVLASSASAPATQRLYANMLGLRAGDVITNVLCYVTTGISGTVPTSVVMGLYTSAYAKVAATAELKSDGQWASAGVKTFALATPYTVTSDGGYYVAFLKDGTWGTTDVQLGRLPTPPQDVTIGSNPPAFGSQAGQTTLPNTATLAASSSLAFWFGVS